MAEVAVVVEGQAVRGGGGLGGVVVKVSVDELMFGVSSNIRLSHCVVLCNLNFSSSQPGIRNQLFSIWVLQAHESELGVSSQKMKYKTKLVPNPKGWVVLFRLLSTHCVFNVISFV